MTMLNAREIAELKGCSEASVKRLIRNGQLKAKRTMNEKNRPKYLVLLEDLPTVIQEQYYMKHCVKKEITIGQLLDQNTERLECCQNTAVISA